MCICYLNHRGAAQRNDNCVGLKIAKTIVSSLVPLGVGCNTGLSLLSRKWQDNKSTGASTTHDELQGLISAAMWCWHSQKTRRWKMRILRGSRSGECIKITDVMYRKPLRELIQKPGGIKNNDATGWASCGWLAWLHCDAARRALMKRFMDNEIFLNPYNDPQ